MLRNAALHRAVLAADQPAHLPVGVLPRSMPSMRSCLKTQIGLGFQGRPTLLLRAAAEPAAQTAERGLYSKIQDPEPGQIPRPRAGAITGTELETLQKRFKGLQNGSDVRGIAMAGVPHEPVTLTPGAAFFIGHAFAKTLSKKMNKAPRVAVGRDCRMSGPMMEAALQAGLLAGGARQVDSFGLATTPCMFYSIVADGYEGSIMLTASHMPWNANGLKFFTAAGGFEKSDVASMLQMAIEECAAKGVMVGDTSSENAHVLASALAQDPSNVKQVNFLPRYADFLRELIIKGVNSKEHPRKPLTGMKIVVDAGNGAGGFFATEVLAPLGADITGSQFLDPDGSFPNHIPNPEHPSAMAAGAKATTAAGADLGIVFDTDVDRSAIVDRNGREINSNRFIALMSAVILREHPGTTIVTDSVTSNGLADFIAALGGKHLRFKRGYKNVIGKGMELNNQGVETHLMMETSGHGALKENYFLDDGAYLAVKVVIELVRRRLSGQGDIGELLDTLKEPAEAAEYRLRITPTPENPDFKEVGQMVLDRFHNWIQSGGAGPSWSVDPINHEGWRINVAEDEGRRGWLLLRQSLHDPLLVLNVESESSGQVREYTKKVLEFMLQSCTGLAIDVAPLSKK
eukprot:CAMPEP_0202373016 /NCGR_PEP_ID=MMETSP1127-20130417/4110_1 /ASSEMBLY_ACC=CAM_ASM_000462 /TAXON_ID=3047 /ORGANISM="Dunaliella tertiolecta, Strain CCMP1320" /LENGTH=628 /DNA_ID=CAMNT_0048969755 /DNA_START=3126 /DNA_END=5012 /DNA_ORIENTATION=+